MSTTATEDRILSVLEDDAQASYAEIADRADVSKPTVRKYIQQLEEEGLVETAQGQGRRIAADGQSFLDNAAVDVLESLDRPDLERYA